VRKDVTVVAEAREQRGKNEARRLRVSGSVPAVVYGGTAGAQPIAVSPKEITKILHSKTGHNTIFNLDVKGKENTPVMIVAWQFEPIKETLLHCDLKRIDLSKRITVRVPVVTKGDPRGVKIQGGLHEIVTREIEIECLPDDIPEQFEVDVSELMIHQSVRASDIPMGGSVKLLSPADTVISHVVGLKAEEPVAGAEAGATPAAEPEVIKKGKKEEGAEAAAPPKKK
jgi:large subunit ribosomal protein L25